jgi:preprotein translocase subunit SecA
VLNQPESRSVRNLAVLQGQTLTSEIARLATRVNEVRKDLNDLVYLTKEEKFEAVVVDIQSCTEKGAPVLVGTASIETSEELSTFLQKQNIAHQVLNAKYHEREAEIIAQAGRPATVTIATNMAGRGTDIVLGGNLEAELAQLPDATPEQVAALRAEWQQRHQRVLDAGGLHIIGTERHESRRIDNQLRGRSGRQGDPGESRFYLSMEDPLLRIFAGDKMRAIMDRLKMPEGEAIEAGMVSRSIETAQRKVEARNFDIRKQLLEYDDVANDQRREIYQLRNDILEADSVADMVANLRRGHFTDLFRSFVPAESVEEQWDIAGLGKALADDWQIDLPLRQWLETEENLTDETLLERVLKAADEAYAAKVSLVGAESFGNFERSIMLQLVDQQWREHLAALDHLRQGIHLRGYAQKQPKQEYKREAFELFGTLIDRVRADVIRILMNVRIQTPEEVAAAERRIEEESERRMEQARAQHAEFAAAAQAEEEAGETAVLADSEEAKAQPFKRYGDKIGRNDPCPCGSGKKYKQCHGKLA